MNAKDFYALVQDMRNVQNEYLRTCGNDVLNRHKELVLKANAELQSIKDKLK